MDELIFVLLFIVLIAYVLVFYFAFFNSITKRRKKVRFHNAIISIYKSNSSTDDVIEQLSLNFNKLTEVFGRTNEKTVLDILETLVYHYDTFTDDRFESLFNVKKDMNIREYIYKLSKYIKEKEPFASIPAKEANLLNNINDALLKNNIDLGTVSLAQLSKELSSKEIEIKKMEKQNLIGTIVSIIGIILTVIFGILSLR